MNVERSTLVRSVRKLIAKGIAVLLLVLGAATLWLPIPTGVVMLSAGVFLLIGNSRGFARWLRRRRSRNPSLDRMFLAIRERFPEKARRVLDRTAPRRRRSRRAARKLRDLVRKKAQEPCPSDVGQGSADSETVAND